MLIQFDKYQATGNDFVLLDNRGHSFDHLSKDEVAKLCDRRFGIGADGLILLSDRDGYDFEMKYFNADGATGSMCGNGGRCITAFARKCGIHLNDYRFLAYDGDHFSKIQNGVVSLKMNPVHHIGRDGNAFVLDTGSPHYILDVQDVNDIDVFNEGRKIRNADQYIRDGINVNFVQRMSGGFISVRTYERGVEDETYSCGTGVTAAAVALSGETDGHYEYKIKTRGGDLSVSYDKEGRDYDNIWLTGPATFVFSGEINL